MIQVPMRQAGAYIDHDTALQAAAVFACVRVIAEDIAALPWHVYTRQSDGGRERSPMSPVEYVLNKRPNPEMSAFTFRETLAAWALTWGNGYAEISRDMAGRVAELYPISPDRVEVQRSQSGDLYYEIMNSREANTILKPSDVYHLKGIGFDGVVGYSLVSQAARSIGLSISLEEFGSAFFSNGATLGGIIEIPQGSSLTDTAKKNLKETFNKAHKGANKAHKIEVLDVGATYREIGTDPNKGQFTESRQYQVEEICRWFRVPPHKVGHLLRMTFNNVEQLSINYVQESLIPWMSRFEQEADYKLFGNQNTRQYTKISANALLRGDVESRTTFYREMWNLGALSVNEIREYEDMNPVEFGDKRFVQLNMTTLEKAGEEPETPEPEQEPMDIAPEIEEQINNILTREFARFNSYRDRYDRDEYINQVCGHLGSQKVHITNDLTHTLTHILERVGADVSQAESAARIYADLHIEQSRGDAIRLYDGETVDAHLRAHKMALKIRDAVFQDKQASYNPMEDQIRDLHEKIDNLKPTENHFHIAQPDINVDVNMEGQSQQKTVKMSRNENGDLVANVVYLKND